MGLEESTLLEIVIPKTPNKIISAFAEKYLPRTKDDKLGLYWNKKRIILRFETLKLDYDNIIIDDKKYKETRELWKILTYTEAPKSDLQN